MFPLKEPVSFSQKLENHNSLLKKKDQYRVLPYSIDILALGMEK